MYTLLVAAVSLHQIHALTLSQAKQNVISLASELKEKGGVFVANNEQRKELCKAVSELEAICGPPSSIDKDNLLGDWNLLCTTNVNPLPPLPLSFLPRNPIQDELRKVVYSNVDVIQKIRNDSNFEGEEKISRVDNVIQFRTPKDDGSVLSKLPNPLEFSRAKVTLAHSAKVESVSPVLRTKIALKSIILTVAGTSQYLEPDGADVLGINVPTLQDILNVGVFDTPYVDDDIRISRGPAVSGFLDEQIRVFIREKADHEDEGEVVVETSDVDEAADTKDVEIVATEEEVSDDSTEEAMTELGGDVTPEEEEVVEEVTVGEETIEGTNGEKGSSDSEEKDEEISS